MRKRILALLTAASMFVCAIPTYVRACETPPNAKGSYETGLANRNVNAQAVNGRTANNGQATDRVMDSISRVDADNDTRADANANLAPGWQRGGTWSTTSSTTTTTLPTRPTY